MAIIRNTIMAAFRFAGWTNLKKARRHFFTRHQLVRRSDHQAGQNGQRPNMTEPWSRRSLTR